MLIVYVDDFQMAGPARHMEDAWKELREKRGDEKGIDMDDPTDLRREEGCTFLGCKMKIIEPPKGEFEDVLPGHPTGIRYNDDGTTKTVFVSKSQKRKANRNPKGTEEPAPEAVPARYLEYDMEEFWESCVAKYLELAPQGTKLKKVATPFIDEALRDPTDFGAPEDAARAAALLQQEIERKGDN